MAGLLIGTDGANNATVTGTQTLTNKSLTSPTIAGGSITSATTFPAGHVVQIKTSDWATKRQVGSWVTSTSFSWSTYSCAITMTNCTAGNRIMLIGTDSGYQGEWDKASYWTWFVKDNANNEVGLSDLASSSGGMGGNTDHVASFYVNSSAQDWGSNTGINSWYTVQSSSGSSIEFRICIKVGDTSNTWNSQYSTGIAMEVQI